MMNKRNKVDLPEDLIVEIVSRVPARTLARLRSTSKAWSALVKDGRFSKKHSTNAPKQSLIIMLRGFRVCLVSVDIRGMQDNNEVAPSGKIISQFSLKDPLTNYWEEVGIWKIFHCDGLLVCTTNKKILVVWNPVSGETKLIQRTKSYKESDIFVLGYDCKSSCYKIIRIADQKAYDFTSKSWIFDHEIYDFTLNSWNVVGGATTDWFIPENRNRGVSVKGITYWLGHSRYGPFNTLISFDFSTERFQTHDSLPPSLVYSNVALSVVSEEQLCLLDVGPFDVYMASKTESTGVMSWSKIVTAKARNKFSPWVSYLADEHNRVLVCYDNTKDRNNFLHIVAEDTYIQVDLLSYVPTLVQIQQCI